MESITTGLGKEQMDTKSYYMPKMFKMILDDGNVMIIRLDKELIISVMPPERRKIMEQMMGKNLGLGSGGGKLEVKKSGESKTISGYACTKLVVTQDEKEVLVLWTTKDIKEFASIRNDYEQLATRTSSMMASNARWGGGALAQAWPEAMKVSDGFPIQQEMGGIKTVVTKIEQKSTPANAFEPPSGYKRVEPASVER
jgi:uncharacterized protein DUF4412